MNILDVKNLSFKREGNLILHAINISISEGTTVSIVGPSGSGKSSLLKIIASLVNPLQGEIYYFGEDIANLDPIQYRREVQYVHQSPQLFSGTVAENLELPAKIRKEKYDAKRVNDLLARVKLDADKFLNRDVQTLSGGEKQRIALVRSLIFLPKVLLLDEVTSALDEESTSLIEGLIKEINHNGITILWVTHDQEQSKKMADFRIHLDAGHLTRKETIT